MCSEGSYLPDEQVNGECPDCGSPTVDGEAQEICAWSPVICKTCGSAPCDESC